jgi:arylformamidase
MSLIDISLGISPEMPVWPGDPSVRLERVRKISEGANANVSHLACSVHTGTHVDAPLHFIDGASGVEQLPVDALIGRAHVVSFPDSEVINEETLDGADLPDRLDRMLFKTRNSNLWAEGAGTFQEDFVAIDPSGASWLADRGVRLVGVDYLSVAPFGQSREPHQILLHNKIVIVEGLDLSRVEAGEYMLYCLPLKLVGSDGAPARAILQDLT